MISSPGHVAAVWQVLSGGHLLVVGYLATSIGSALVAATAWRRRGSSASGRGIVVIMCGTGALALADLACAMVALGIAPPALAPSAIAATAVGSAVAVAGLWVLCRAVTDPLWWPGRRHVALLSLDPLLAVTLLASEPWWHLSAEEVAVAPGGGQVWISWAPGPGFALHGSVLVGLVLWSLGRLVQGLHRGGPLQRRHTVALLAALSIPMLPNLLGIASTRSGTAPDLVAVSNFATGLGALVVLERQGLLRLVPVARSLVVERLSDPVIVVGLDGRLLDVNTAAERLLRTLDARLPRRLADLSVADLPDAFGAVLADGAVRPGLPVMRSHRVVLAEGPAVLDLRVEEITDAHDERIGRVVVVRDVTVLHARREALAAVNDRLRQQVATIDRLREDLAEQAVRDELTGLHNRRHLVSRLDQEVRAATNDGTELCLVLLDIDHFKSVNDRYGHAVGDQLLAATAKALTAAAGPHDTIARYGGEEFVVLLPRTTVEQAALRADGWRQRCSTVQVPGADGPISRTISAGLAGLRAHVALPADATRLLEAADRALYEAKSGGRDRIVVARAEPPPPHPFARPETS